MERFKKPDKFSWPSTSNFSTVNLFPSEDYKSKVGLDAHHLLAKMSCISHSNGVDSDGRSTGYTNPLNVSHYGNTLKEKHPHIPQIKWKCPPKFALNNDWRVAAGEDSAEAEAQKHREMLVPEAVYPFFSAIPPSPSISIDVEDCNHDDNHIPLISVVPIEEAAASNLQSDIAAPLNSSVNSQFIALPQDLSTSGNSNPPQCNHPISPNPPANEKRTLDMLPGLEGDDMVVAAAAAVTAIVKSEEQGSSIDTNLLIQLLRDPKMIEKLINEHEAAANTGTGTGSMSDLATQKSTYKYGRPANTRTLAISASMTPTQSRPLSSSKDEMVTKKFDNHLRAPARAGNAFIYPSKPMTQLVPLPNLNLDVPLNKNLINERGESALAETARVTGTKLGTFPAPLPGANQAEMLKKLINEYGALNNTGSEPLSRPEPTLFPFLPSQSEMPMWPRPAGKSGNESLSRPEPSLVPFSTPKPEMMMSPRPKTANVLSSLHRKPRSPDVLNEHPFSGSTSIPVKDINYYKTLIKQHGERQETKDHNLSQFGKPHNYIGGTKLVPNLKSNESELKYQKPCIYFNSARGCQSGSNCPYRHDTLKRRGPGGALAAPGAKRMKLGRGDQLEDMNRWLH